MSSRDSSRRRKAGLLACILAAGLLVAAGCAGRGRGAPRPGVEPRAGNGPSENAGSAEAAKPGLREEERSEPQERTESITLPGAEPRASLSGSSQPGGIG